MLSTPACHTRWELNDLARRLDVAELRDDLVPAPASSDSALTSDARRMLETIDQLPDEEREAFELARIQGMSQSEAARVLGVSVATINRRLSRGLQLLAAELGDLYSDVEDPGEL